MSPSVFLIIEFLHKLIASTRQVKRSIEGSDIKIRKNDIRPKETKATL